MEDVYYNLVKNGKKDIDEIPEEFRLNVQTRLEEENA